MKSRRAGLAGALVLGLVACGHAQGAGMDAAPPHPLLAERGAEDFRTYCASCHGLDGSGSGPAAPALRQVPADLTRIAQRRGGAFPEAEIASHIDGRLANPAHGTREMPIWGVHLGDAYPRGEFREEIVRGRIVTLVDYLKTLQR